jgi:hypothetical protein
MQQQEISRFALARYIICPSLFVMLALMIVEAMLTATTTWLVINAGRKVASGHFLLNDLLWILSAQSTSYVAGVISWIFAERAGYRGLGQYMLRFARENRGKSSCSPTSRRASRSSRFSPAKRRIVISA